MSTIIDLVFSKAIFSIEYKTWKDKTYRLSGTLEPVQYVTLHLYNLTGQSIFVEDIYKDKMKGLSFEERRDIITHMYNDILDLEYSRPDQEINLDIIFIKYAKYYLLNE